MRKPTITPKQALDRVLSEGQFEKDGFRYDMNYVGPHNATEDSATAEDLESGNLFFASGEFGEDVAEDASWICS